MILRSIFAPSLRGAKVATLATKQSSTDIASSFLRLEDGLPREGQGAFARNDGMEGSAVSAGKCPSAVIARSEGRDLSDEAIQY